MRNITYILILILAIFTSCNSKQLKEYEGDMKSINNLKGSIKGIKTETFEATEKFGETVKGESANPHFDLSDMFPNYIEPNSLFEFTKSGKFQLKELTTKSYSYIIKNKYDYNNNLEEQVFKSDNNETLSKFKNDADNLLISRVTYDKEENITSSYSFIYDNKLIKEVKRFNSNENVILVIKYIYENKIQTQNIYNKSGDLDRSSKKDIDGRYVEIKEDKNETIRVKYQDDMTFPIEIINYRDNEIDGKMELSCDDDDNIEEIKEIDEVGEIETLYKYSYKFDKQGNWVERFMYEDGDLEYITTRIIEYY